MKRIIRMDETALNEIIAESVKEIMLNEGFATNMTQNVGNTMMKMNPAMRNTTMNNATQNWAKTPQQQQQNNVLSQLKMLQQQLNQIIAQMS